MSKPHNSGDDVAGYVEKAGPQVTGFVKGQRVAGFHTMVAPHGSFAEYALVEAHTTFHIPDSVSFEEAATIPLAAYTAAVAVHHALGLPAAWDPKLAETVPIVVYGASTAIGAFGLKLLKRAGHHPVIAVGSKTSSFVTPLLEQDKGDVFVDYTAFDSLDKVSDELRAILLKTGARSFRAFDCVSENGTFELLTKALAGLPRADGSPKHKVTVVLPGKDYSSADTGAELVVTSVGKVFKEEEAGTLFGAVWTAAFAAGLRDGWLAPHPHEAVQGLEALEGALKALRDGKVRGKKMVIRIGKDENAGQPSL
jgi:NADPH2:quinone reductase